MRPSYALFARPPIRRPTSRQSWNAFVESATSHYPSSTSSAPTLREEYPIPSPTKPTSPPSYRRFKPASHFSIYKMTEIQRTVEESADYKLVFYAPVDSVSRIKDAIFEVGGGVLGGGKYTRCCFSSYGTGQFKAEVGAKGGEVGVVTVREEVKVEVLCHGKKVTKAAVRALLHTHPLDAPAYEVYKTEFGFLPHQLIAQPTVEGRLSWRPKTEQEEKLANQVQEKISKQFEGAKLAVRQGSSQTTVSDTKKDAPHPTATTAGAAGAAKLESEDEKLTALLDFLDKNSNGAQDNNNAVSRKQNAAKITPHHLITNPGDLSKQEIL
ncbi:hypothetical protein TWF481_007827 [Arthrobotrys musiformis]|uniref:ATP phosphoribosyltransferase n=1 Tax=Arthrobotrys musiformis TaxID=47236 RepID=A0AAV9W7W4_9PEZI